MNLKSSSLLKVSVIIPVFIIFAWWLKLALVANNGQMVAFGVVGYDPRDLLAGHYLTYRVQYVPADPCLEQNSSDSLCLCINGEANEITWKGNCEQRPTRDCSKYLRGRCSDNRFEAGIERFYIPETFASTNAIPENSFIFVALSDDGTGIVTDFRVGDQSLLDWLQQQHQP